ncbi:MAG: class B sortase [Anaerolineaceae bacterium]|nr:class B sortase [Anaerolineaceae bacterium]
MKNKCAAKPLLVRVATFLFMLFIAGNILWGCVQTSLQSQSANENRLTALPSKVSHTPLSREPSQTSTPTQTPTPSPTPNPYAAEFAEVSASFKEDFRKYQAINKDILAWLEIKAANISQPVLLGPDNEHYLKIGFDTQDAPMGSIFFDMRTKTDFSDKNIVIYGHNWDNGRMFSNLIQYRNQQFLNENLEYYLYTPKAIYRAQIAALVIVEHDDPSMLFPEFDNPSALEEYLSKMGKQAELRTKINLKETDQFISLYTCLNNAQNQRMILVGKLIEIGRYP